MRSVRLRYERDEFVYCAETRKLKTRCKKIGRYQRSRIRLILAFRGTLWEEDPF